jgi:hypothetical protein
MQLREYQIDISTRATAILREHKIVYLALQVRVGKTLTAMQTADNYGALSVLFLTKLKAISSIQKDYEALEPGFRIRITNYENVHNLLDEDFDLIICDEAQCLGQYPAPAEKTKKLKELCAGKPIIYLSGTPSPESYSQLYHQFWISEFSPFAEWKTFYKWAVDFVKVKKKIIFGKQFNDYSAANKEKIDSLTAHLFISFTQEEAGFSQLVEEEILLVRMKPTTYGLANILQKKQIHTGKNGEVVLADTAAKLMQKLHQVYSGTVKLEAGDVSALSFDNSKVTFIREFFAGKKIAIFYKFIAEGIMIRGWLGRPITEDPQEFNACDDKVFISQIQSGREGVNLSTADCLVMFNIDFSSLSYWQSRARLQTRDRATAAKVYWVFAEGGIEQKIYDRVLHKKNFTLDYFKRVYNVMIAYKGEGVTVVEKAVV